MANGGTLFLDEIGNLPVAGQVKLLRVLETGKFEMLGSSRTRSTHVRVLSATNADLPALIREGRFREDLYYRLNVIEIGVPSLVERPADILPLARHFLGAAHQLSEDAAAALVAHDWPGNVRELRNSMERVKLLAREKVVTASDLNLPPPQRAPEAETARRDVEQISADMIEAALREAGGNISRAANNLGLSRQALYRRMERFNLRPPGAG
jgi:DNA-binding NtrC family response regulator